MSWQNNVTVFVEALKQSPIGLRGVVLYGSRARDSASADSDTDLLILVADKQDPATLRQSIHNMIISRRLAIDKISWNVLTESRLRRCLTYGDPFVLSMCFDGVIVWQEGNILSDILTDIHHFAKIYDSADVLAVVRKNHEHLQFCLSATFIELLSYAQQLTITGSQISLLHQKKKTLTVNDLLALAKWDTIRQELKNCGVSPSTLNSMDELAQGFKSKSVEQSFSELCDGLAKRLLDASSFWRSMTARYPLG